jgi:hypothetical protein
MYEFVSPSHLGSLSVSVLCYNQDTEASRGLREECGLIELAQIDGDMPFGLLQIEVRMPTVICFVLR